MGIFWPLSFQRRDKAGVNLANFLLVTGKSAKGDPEGGVEAAFLGCISNMHASPGISPDLACEIAKRLGTGLRLVPFPNPKETLGFL